MRAAPRCCSPSKKWTSFSRMPIASWYSTADASSRPARQHRCEMTLTCERSTSAATKRQGAPMLEVRALCAGYGQAQILFDLSLTVRGGEAVVLLGRNGAGQSTTLKALAGVLRPWRGEVRFDGTRIDRLPSHLIARAGLGYVPQERRRFTTLSASVNLEV